MVTKGQFLERPTLIPVGDLVLEGLSHRGQACPPLLVLPPSPSEGGSMDHVLCAEVVWAAAQAGHPTLRFNFRGVGASQGQRANGETLLADAQAALRLLEENTGTPRVAVAAVDGTSTTAKRLAKEHPALAGLCFIAPVGLRPEDLLRLELPVCVVVAEEDDTLPRAALAAAVAEQGGTLEVVERADARFHRSLPQVGKAVVRFLRRLDEGGSALRR
ncbi:MAG: alpha/beta hydrolase [Myxococcota bacterium]